MYGIAGWLLLGLGVAAVLSGLGGLVQTAGTADLVVPLSVLLVGLLFAAAGVLVNPRFRRRIDRRHGVSRFGQVRTVDSRALSAAENRTETCVGCGRSTAEGLVRRYRREFVVAGVPVRTTAESHNVYCPTCATEELASLSRTVEGSPADVDDPVETETFDAEEAAETESAGARGGEHS